MRLLAGGLAALGAIALVIACSAYGEATAPSDASTEETSVDAAPEATPVVAPEAGGCTLTPDSCPVGEFCLATPQGNVCAPGCSSDVVCRAQGTAKPYCNLTRHECVACTSKADCPASGENCSPAGVCAKICLDNDASTCPPNHACCGGLCIDTRSDPSNCNGCGKACTGATTTCCSGACVDPLTTAAHCGGCGKPCSTSHGTPSCTAGSCSWTCDTGWNHCQTGNTGCETDTSGSVTQCGSCTNDCNAKVKNATGITCTASKCTYGTCSDGYGDCDGDKENGCDCSCGTAGGACCPGNKCGTGLACHPNNKCYACVAPGAACYSGTDCCSGSCSGIHLCD